MEKAFAPLVGNCTNSVAANFCANVLLAAGASPVMFSERREAGQIARQSDALVLNIGTLDIRQCRTMIIAASAAHQKGIPWVLDPAGIGMSRFRCRWVKLLIRRFRPNVIKGNASEISFLSSMLAGKSRRLTASTSRGLDSTLAGEEAVAAAKALSLFSGAVVVVSGETDHIVFGQQVSSLSGGSPMMACVTAMGCAASALCGAMLAVAGSAQDTSKGRNTSPDKGGRSTTGAEAFSSAEKAMSLMKRAGHKAAQTAHGPGTFQAAFIDAIHSLSKTDG